MSELCIVIHCTVSFVESCAEGPLSEAPLQGQPFCPLRQNLMGPISFSQRVII